jgi:hypothetical protein
MLLLLLGWLLALGAVLPLLPKGDRSFCSIFALILSGSPSVSRRSSATSSSTAASSSRIRTQSGLFLAAGP